MKSISYIKIISVETNNYLNIDMCKSESSQSCESGASQLIPCSRPAANLEVLDVFITVSKLRTKENFGHNQGLFMENVRYLVWTCRDPISLILRT